MTRCGDGGESPAENGATLFVYTGSEKAASP